VYTSDVEQKTVDEALRITYSQSKKVVSTLSSPLLDSEVTLRPISQLLQEYGLDFRFLLDQLLIKDPKPRASAHSTHIISVDDLKRASAASQAPKAPTPTPTSPSPQTRTRTLSASRSRTPNLAPPLPVPIPIPITPASSSGGRSMTPVTAASSPSSMDAGTAVQPRLRPPRTPPPRSRDRPPSSARSAAAAVPRREGMF
jgi:exocyst complex component 8